MAANLIQISRKSGSHRSPSIFRTTPRKYVFWGAIQYFAGQRYTLTKLQNACNFYIVIVASLVDSEKDTKLRAHTVNLAFKLRSFVG